jgi:5'-nucleotidase
MESRFLGVHSMAFSQKSELMDEVTNRYLREIMKKCIEKPLGQNEIWNVNFPACRLEDCKGVLWDRTVSIDNFYVDDYDEKVLEDGTREYKMVVGRNWEASEGTDLKAIMENYVSVGVVKNLQS